MISTLIFVHVDKDFGRNYHPKGNLEGKGIIGISNVQWTLILKFEPCNLLISTKDSLYITDFTGFLDYAVSFAGGWL